MASLETFEPAYLQLRTEGDVVLVSFRQRHLTEEDNIERIGFELFALVDQYGTTRIVLDLSDVDLVTSSMLGKMITLHRRLHRVDGKLTIFGDHDAVTEVLRTSKLSTYFNMAEDRDQALKSVAE